VPTNWWDSLSYNEQKEYLKEHPGSKRKVNKRAARKVASKDLDPKTIAEVEKYLSQNKNKIAKASVPIVRRMENNLFSSLKKTPKKEIDRLATTLRSAITLKDHPALAKMAKGFGVKSGVMFIGVVGLSLLTGIDISIAVPIIASNFWKDIQEAPDNLEYVKNAYGSYCEETRKALSDADKLKEAIVTEEKPSVTIDEDEEAEKAMISTSSRHETDLTKTLHRIEKMEIASQMDVILAASKNEDRATTIKRLIKHRERIETAIPSIASVFVSAVSQRASLSSRAQNLLGVFNKELNRCRAEIASYAKRSTPNSTSPLMVLLKKRIKSSEIKSEVSFVRCEDNNIHRCEVHSFLNVETASQTITRLDVYGFFDKEKQLNIALSQNTDFVPKAFTNIKPNKVCGWLKENGVS